MQINLFDTNTLITNGDNLYANNLWPVEGLEYNKTPYLDWSGITVFTDEMCFSPVVDDVKSKYKIAWALESPVIKPHVYQWIHQIEDKFDYIYVCGHPKLDASDPKYKQCYFGACWLREEDCKVYPKSKLLSIVASNKTFAAGHKLRHELIAKEMHPELELWGSGYRWFDNNSGEPFFDYRYVIVVENCQYPGYFTDKILDCFAAGCIPIYWGAPDIGKLFDERGFYTWNTLDELQEILSMISEEDYDSKAEFIEENFSRFWEFASPDKWMLDNCYQGLEKDQ